MVGHCTNLRNEPAGTGVSYPISKFIWSEYTGSTFHSFLEGESLALTTRVLFA